MKRHLNLCLLLFSLAYSTSSSAGLIDSLRQYRLGVDYAYSKDEVILSYDMDVPSSVTATCTRRSDDTTKQRCDGYSIVGASSSGFGFFFQKAFKRQGFYFFDYDVSFGGRYLSGELPKSESSKNGLPLRQASFTLGAAIIKPYIQFGVTPDWYPDFLVSLGPALQVAAGKFSINDKPQSVVFGTSSYTGIGALWQGFLEVEIVLRRFGDGAFSLLSTADITGSGEGTKVYPKTIDGMSEIRGRFQHSAGGVLPGIGMGTSFGLKLLLPFP